MFPSSAPARLTAGLAAAALILSLLGVPPAQAAPGDGEPIADLGAILGRTDSSVTIAAGPGRLRISGSSDETLRVEYAPDGTFVDPDAAPSDPNAPKATMVLDRGPDRARVTVTETAEAYTIRTPAAALTVTRKAPKMTLTDARGTVLFAETAPLTVGAEGTTQRLAPRPGEQFYGAGEQNGMYNRTGKVVSVANSFNWNEGGTNNSQPYYVSTAGYGVFRHTYAPGSYDFTGPVGATHNERRFDAYYFVGDLKGVIGSYTDLVGKPFMPPIYGLELGDADCYLHNANRGERRTKDALKIADGFVEAKMPLGWMLVNDGYGCGYEDLAEVSEGLEQRNAQIGLWTQDGLNHIAEEQAADVRVRKLDVAWVGPGYRFALNGCQDAYNSLLNDNKRGFVYMPNSWAGAQRCSVLWSGDQSGSWDYIRWQIPTYAASTMSGIAYNTGDIDGIFGGSEKTYVRDLQWKMMLPTTMTMDGWSVLEKQPWRYSQQANAINKKYLDLHEQLMPYFYTYSDEANRTGVGQVRPLYLEYPDDKVAQTDAAKYEFLSGKDFLVAPVYSDTSVRNGIYLPEGTWVDYWSGRTFRGPMTIDGYHAPLDTMPMFVRAGAIVPMWPQGTTSWKTRDTSLLEVDIYPQGSSEFSLYEDDGVTRGRDTGASSRQRFGVRAPQAGPGRINVDIGSIDGQYAGQAEQRAYRLKVHSPAKPSGVRAGDRALPEVADAEALAAAPNGWYYDPAAKVAQVKTDPIARGTAATVTLDDASALTGERDDSAGRLQLEVPPMIKPGESATVPVRFTNNTTAVLNDLQITLSSDHDGVRLSEPVPAPGNGRWPRALRPGESVTFTATLSVAPDATPGRAVITASASWLGPSGGRYRTEYAAETTVPYPSVQAAFDNNGITELAGAAEGEFDGPPGTSSSFRVDGLAEAGFRPGGTVSVDGIDYPIADIAPAAKDNVVAAGQTIALDGSGTAVGLLGSGAGTARGEVTVSYTDGSTSKGTVDFTNWCCTAIKPTNTLAAASKGKHVGGQPTIQYPATDYRIFAATVRADPAKQVAAITLPASTGMHIFSAAVGDKALPPPPGAGDTWLSDLTWISATNGWGPVEKNTSNGENAAGDGQPISIRGQRHDKGLGVHAVSEIEYNLGGKCTTFTATVGIDDEVENPDTRMIFSVRVDGVEKAVSPTVDNTDAPVQLSVPVSGGQTLVLQARSGTGDISGAHGDWASAKVTCTG